MLIKHCGNKLLCHAPFFSMRYQKQFQEHHRFYHFLSSCNIEATVDVIRDISGADNVALGAGVVA